MFEEILRIEIDIFDALFNLTYSLNVTLFLFFASCFQSITFYIRSLLMFMFWIAFLETNWKKLRLFFTIF